MNTRRIDEYARSLATKVPRRHALRCLGGGAVAALLGHQDVAAACKSRMKPCDKNKDCCNKRCKQGRCRCKYLGQTCKVTAHCCMGACTGGKCCLEEGTPCVNDSACCSGNCYCPPGGETKYCLGPAG